MRAGGAADRPGAAEMPSGRSVFEISYVLGYNAAGLGAGGAGSSAPTSHARVVTRAATNG